MDIKTIFNEFEVKIEDAVFTMREMDVSSCLQGAVSYSSDSGNKIEIDMMEVMTKALIKSIISWTGLKSAETKEDLKVNADTIRKLPFLVKNTLFEELQKRSTIQAEEKKN